MTRIRLINMGMMLPAFLLGMSATAASLPFSTDISDGRWPEGFSTSNANGVTPDVISYKNGYTTDGWTTARVGTTGYAFVSPTHNEEGKTAENVLSLPALEITEGTWLRWSAMSVYPAFPESYHVDVTVPELALTKTIATVSDELSTWNIRLADLSEFAGQEVVVKFVATGTDTYMLALSDIFVGTPHDNVFIVSDGNRRYAGLDQLDSEGRLPIEIDVTNAGAPLSGDITWTADGTVIATQSLQGVWATGERRRLTADIPATEDKRTIWKVSAGSTEIASQSFYTSRFERFHVVDEATGMWCNNCPEGVLEIQKLHQRFGQNIIPVVTHIASTSTDVLENPEYFQNLKFYAVPYYRIDRNADASGKMSNLEKYLDVPTDFSIEIESVKATPGDIIEPTVVVRAADGTDTSGDRYRVGYVMVSDYRFEPGFEFFQNNNLNSPTYKEYYFLPSVFMGSLAAFDHVSITCDNAFSGFENSIPSEIPQDGATFSWQIQRPELLMYYKDASLVAYVLDTQSGRIENAAVRNLEFLTGVRGITADDSRGALSITLDGTGRCGVSVPEGVSDVRVNVYDLSGRIISGRSLNAVAGHAETTFDLAAGVYIIKAEADGLSATAKFSCKH